MAVVKFRPFKIPQESTAPSFNPIKLKDLQEFMENDLKESGLEPGDLHAYVHTKAVPQGAKKAYVIPYFTPEGNPIVDTAEYIAMWRKKIDPPIKKSKYIQPPAADLAALGIPRYVPYITPKSLSLEGDTLYICEGEKKTACFMKYMKEPAIGIGGCRMWHDPDGSGNVHPWIMEVVRSRGFEKIVIIPDNDLWKYDICRAYGDFSRTLEKEGLTVELIDLSGQPLKGVDDFLVRWKLDGPGMLMEFPKLKPAELYQTPNSLISEYNLPFRESKDGKKAVEQKTSTIQILLENHPAFPQIWRDSDTQRIYIGDELVKDGFTAMDIANYMQLSFGLNQINARMVLESIIHQASKNERSPFLDEIRKTRWDGKKRLETWMIEHWGVEDTKYAREVSLKWLVASCNRLKTPGCKMDWMLVMTGGQGTGKSSMPAILFDDHSVIMYGEHHDKDLHMKLHSGLCIVVDELDSFTKRDSTYWKSVLTTNSDSFRAPYAASVAEYPRRSVLYGTSNLQHFLASDPSGYRRYAILSPQRKLDFEWLEENRWQIWAEAWAIHEDVEYWEIENVNEIAESHVVENPLAQDIERVLTIRSSNDPFQMIDLLKMLNMESQIRNVALTRDIASILKSLGYSQARRRTSTNDNPKRMWAKD